MSLFSPHQLPHQLAHQAADKVAHLGRLDVWEVPSSSQPGVMRYVIELPGGSYVCSCPIGGQRLCPHVRQVVSARIEQGSRSPRGRG